MGTLNIRAYVVVIVFALVLAFVIGLGIQQGWGAFSKPIKKAVLNRTVVKESAFAPGVIDMGSVDLAMSLTPPSAAEEIRQVQISLGKLNYHVHDDVPDVTVSEVCITNIGFWLTADSGAEIVHDFLPAEVCDEPDDSDFSGEDVSAAWGITDLTIKDVYSVNLPLTETRPLQINDTDFVSLNFWYPYDSFTLKGYVGVYYTIITSDGKTIEGNVRPYLYWDVLTSGTRSWDVRLKTEAVTIEDDEATTAGTMETIDMLTINFDRSLFYRISFPFFLVAMTALIGLMPLLGERDAFVEITASMMFGIFSLKGILGTNDQMGQTILDISLVGLYIVLAFSGTLYFVTKIRRKQDAETE